ncbi:MAG: hypothetical protein ACOCRK_11660 [bacterium]
MNKYFNNVKILVIWTFCWLPLFLIIKLLNKILDLENWLVDKANSVDNYLTNLKMKEQTELLDKFGNKIK